MKSKTIYYVMIIYQDKGNEISYRYYRIRQSSEKQDQVNQNDKSKTCASVGSVGMSGNGRYLWFDINAKEVVYGGSMFQLRYFYFNYFYSYMQMRGVNYHTHSHMFSQLRV